MEKIILSSDTAYKLGDFNVYLDSETGHLRVIVETHRHHIQVKPSSGNAVILIPSK